MHQIELEVTNREVLGKKVRVLRRHGIIPLHVFGHGVASAALQCDAARLRRVLMEAGQTRIISLKLDGETEPRNVIVRQVQREPRTGETLHVDFYQVKMAEPVKMEVPIVLVGEAPILRFKENSLVHELTALAIECLPAQIPNSIEFDISSLTEPDQVLRVSDIVLEEGITITSEPGVVVARISSRPVGVIEEEEEAVVAEEAVTGVEAAAEEPDEG